MRFMMLMIPQVYQGGADADFRPDPEAIATMTAYNVRLGEAGVLVALEGLHPPSNGARVSFRNKTPVVTDGPFTETREVLGGYWVIDVKDRAEAIEWARRIPANEGDIVEVRQIFDAADFSDEVKQAVQDAGGGIHKNPDLRTRQT